MGITLTLGIGCVLLMVFLILLVVFKDNRKTSDMLTFGVAVVFVSMCVLGTYRDYKHNKAWVSLQADIKARTVVQRGVVNFKDEWVPLKSSAGKKGAPRCLIELKESPYTFTLPERDGWNRHCADIQLRDIVTVKFVRPLDKNISEVDALEFVDHTYEINGYNSSQPRN